ncbi:ABC transporter permease [Nitriliruptoraceae bacterium ZYF776]|nr:ABC transporter permease [Profundirhabdus halotolerans]
MSSTLTPPELDDVARGRAEDVAAGKKATRARRVHLFGMPIFLVVLLTGTFLWIAARDLDSIERRSLRIGNLWEATVQHAWLTVLSTFFVLLLAIPLGILITRPRYRRLAPAIIGLGNAGQAIPSIGMLALVFFLAPEIPFIPRTGTTPAVIGLVAYSFLAILRNTMVGLDQVDRSVLEAGRGMGMSQGRVLRRIELPLAVPVILAGVRTALVLNVGTATLAFFIGGGGLGDVIITGVGLRRAPVLVAGAVLVAALALFVDYLASLVEERLTPKGL